MRHFITLNDITNAELKEILHLATEIKADYKKGKRKPLLQGKTLAMIFEKQSLRTRVSFEAGMAHLGGSTLFLGAEVGYGKRETTADFGRVLSSMVDAIVFRAKSHKDVTELAEYCSCPVINALTDEAHPCQALADVMTVYEKFGTFEGVKIAWIGDSNNVTSSLVRACAKLGLEISIASPPGYSYDDQTIEKIVGNQREKGFKYELTSDPVVAVKDANAVYTDVWVSMGQENEEAKRKKDLADYQVNSELMKKAAPDAIFLHCLPAKRGQEVTDNVMDSPQSAIVQQAENRLHAQKGLLVWLLENKK